MPEYGFKVSQPGYNVLTAADKDLVFSSKYSSMKVALHNVKATPGAVAHGLAYVPMFLNFVKISSSYEIESEVNSYPGSYADTSNVTFTASGNYYFIFIDPSS